MRIFVAGPYHDMAPGEEIAQNVANADAVGRELVLRGHFVFVPHKMTHGWQLDKRLNRSHWIALDDDFLLNWAEGIYRLSGQSNGADREVELARLYGLPIYYSLDEVPQR